jgi:hypothetical protein
VLAWAGSKHQAKLTRLTKHPSPSPSLEMQIRSSLWAQY